LIHLYTKKHPIIQSGAFTIQEEERWVLSMLHITYAIRLEFVPC